MRNWWQDLSLPSESVGLRRIGPVLKKLRSEKRDGHGELQRLTVGIGVRA
jgi:hypothetical protein